MTSMKITVDLEPKGSEYKPGDILIYADNVTGYSGPGSTVVHSVAEVGPAIQAMVEHNVRNMVANAENELKPITEKKERLERWLDVVKPQTETALESNLAPRSP